MLHLLWYIRTRLDMTICIILFVPLSGVNGGGEGRGRLHGGSCGLWEALHIVSEPSRLVSGDCFIDILVHPSIMYVFMKGLELTVAQIRLLGSGRQRGWTVGDLPASWTTRFTHLCPVLLVGCLPWYR
ncbi:hypothetical protein BJY04DRAFT_186192 [Aspergillus karnatakaensis]|uniref:uncharacterized protein n=1 Tax=Aspergillus karnatakaensis TaxID=1810916 RepID=UPI003CCE16B6